MALNVVDRIDDLVDVRNVIVSVWDKTGLETFIPALCEACPKVRFYSTGGTYGKLEAILAGREGALVRIADYTGQPEMQGGLVKTLDFKLYLGLLSETYNEAHREDLARVQGVDFDLVVANLYPFQAASSAEGATLETARGHVDIGGPCMVRAAAKNFLRTAPVVDPADYGDVARAVAKNGGKLDLATRYRLSTKAFAVTSGYDRAVADYLAARTAEDAASIYTIL